MSDPIPDFMPPPNRPVQIRCPLTLKQLDQIPRLSDEHVIHEAIGGPRWYSVRADADENSRFGREADSRFLNSDIVKLWRIRNGILGRSEKELSLRLKGTLKGKDQKVIVTFKHKSTEVDYVPRLIRNEDGRSGRIVVSADRAEQELVRITNDFAKKQIRLTVKNSASIEMAEIDVPFEIDLAPLWAGALKIAYLTAFDFLGDPFLDDPLNSAWRQAIQAETMNMLKESPIEFQLRITGPVPSPLAPTEHFVYI
jgi:hypothetical protein